MADEFLNGVLGGGSNFAAPQMGMERLVGKEESLGVVREIVPPENHMGLQFAPMMEVNSDDVIFDYIKDTGAEGMIPARAEDAEAELARADDMFFGQGRASIIDWAEKHKYTASDVTRYRSNKILMAGAQGASSLPLNDSLTNVQDFERRVARDDARRVRRIWNRVEWLIWEGLWNGSIGYNDGNIRFSVDFQRPAANTWAVGGGASPLAPTVQWNAGTEHDPIGDLKRMKRWMEDTYQVEMTRAITSRKVLETLWRSDRFTALTGLVTNGGATATKIDINYLMPGFTEDSAIRAVEAATGITFIINDNTYSTRPFGSKTVTRARYTPEDEILFLPGGANFEEIDDTELGFGKTLTSPHPEGNWQSGMYEWEDEKRDPWMHVRGTGMKAFPIFPYLRYTARTQVITL